MDTFRAFEWDDAKAARNLAKHGVPFAYAARVFLDAARSILIHPGRLMVK